MISRASAEIELGILWFRVQSLAFRVGSAFATALLGMTSLYAGAPLVALILVSLSVSAAIDTWWERYFEQTIDQRIQTELQMSLAGFREQVELRAAQMAAEAVLQKEQQTVESQEEPEPQPEDDSADYEYEFPAKYEGQFPNPETGSGAVAVGEHGWKNKNWNGKGNGDVGTRRSGEEG